MSNAPANDLVLDVKQLRTSFFVDGEEYKAVDGASFQIRRGRVMALVGESGCGKSVTSYSMLRLVKKPGKIVGGNILFHPADGGEVIDIAGLKDHDPRLFQIRGGLISMIFQEPMTALSPLHTVGNQVTEAILCHQSVSRKQAWETATQMLSKVGIPNAAARMKQYPHEMSGGMRQRVVIAMALVCRPQLLIADEPTTALDVTIQAQVMSLLKDLQKDLGTAILLITHDLGVVAQMADDVAVMYLGRIVESGPMREVLKNPRHPYTQGLLASLPSLNTSDHRLYSIPGSVPRLTSIPPGCPFHPRCEHFKEGLCNVGDRPKLEESGDGRGAACFRLEELQR